MGYQRLLQALVALLCVLFPVWGSVLLLVAVHSAYPDYPLWPPAPAPALPTPAPAAPTPAPAPGPPAPDAAKVKRLEERLEEKERKLSKVEAELNRTLENSGNATALGKKLLEERRRREAAEQAADAARQEAARLREELVAAQGGFVGPVVDRLEALNQHFLATVLGLLGAAGVVGPRQVVWAFCPVAGSIIGGLLAASCVGLYGAGADGVGWASCIGTLLAGSGSRLEYVAWGIATCFGLLRWLFQWNCYYVSAEVDLDGPFEDGPLEEPLLKLSKRANDTCEGPLRIMARCPPMEAAAWRDIASRLGESMPWMHRRPGDDQADLLPPPARGGGDEEELMAPDPLRPSPPPSQVSGQSSQRLGRPSQVSGLGSLRPSQQQGRRGPPSEMGSEPSSSHDTKEALQAAGLDPAEFEAAQEQMRQLEAAQARLRQSEQSRTSVDGRVPPIQGMPSGSLGRLSSAEPVQTSGLPRDEV